MYFFFASHWKLLDLYSNQRFHAFLYKSSLTYAAGTLEFLGAYPPDTPIPLYTFEYKSIHDKGLRSRVRRNQMRSINTAWNKRMTIAEMLPLMSDAEIDSNARKGGIAAIEEQKRRRAPTAPSMQGSRWADRIMPDPELELGV